MQPSLPAFVVILIGLLGFGCGGSQPERSTNEGGATTAPVVVRYTLPAGTLDMPTRHAALAP